MENFTIVHNITQPTFERTPGFKPFTVPNNFLESSQLHFMIVHGTLINPDSDIAIQVRSSFVLIRSFRSFSRPS